jgi:hypothetical protein
VPLKQYILKYKSKTCEGSLVSEEKLFVLVLTAHGEILLLKPLPLNTIDNLGIIMSTKL